MMRLKRFGPELSFVFKNILKRQKSVQGALIVDSLGNGKKESENHSCENKVVKKLPIFMRIANEENLELDDLMTPLQDLEDVEQIFKEIAQGDAEREKQLRLLLYEVMLKREEEELVPNRLTKKHWEELLKLPSLSMRKKYLVFLYKIEKKRESTKIKDELRRREFYLFEELTKNFPHIYYGLSGNSMFFRIYPQTLNVIQDIRALTNKFFAPPILFDCSYQEYMSPVNTKFCAQQLALSFKLNRVHPYPCSLQLVNLKKDELLMKYLKVHMKDIEASDMPLETSEKSYLDLYPKEKLVYLTPHTRNTLNEFRLDDIFIIGAFVDKGFGIQASLAKAKQDGLRMAKFPIDKYILWRKGTKSLTLNNVLNILLDMRYYRNWDRAFKSLPTRNFKD